MPKFENLPHEIDSQGLDPEVNKERIELMKQEL